MPRRQGRSLSSTGTVSGSFCSEPARSSGRINTSGPLPGLTGSRRVSRSSLVRTCSSSLISCLLIEAFYSQGDTRHEINDKQNARPLTHSIRSRRGARSSGSEQRLVLVSQPSLERNLAFRLGGGWGLDVFLIVFFRGGCFLALGRQEGEGDPLQVRLDLEDPDFDLLACLDDVDDAADAGGRKLGDVDQTLDAGLELDEGSKFHQLGDLARDHQAAGILRFRLFPRAGGELFQAQRQLPGHGIDLDHLDLNLVAGLDQVIHLLDPRPAHFADWQETVNAAKVHERAEVFDRAHGPLADLADLQLAPGLLTLLGPFLFEQVAP